MTSGLLSVLIYPGAPVVWEAAHKVGSRQFCGSGLQHRTSSDIDGGVEVSVLDLLACSAAG